jgi:hypothetical protein
MRYIIASSIGPTKGASASQADNSAERFADHRVCSPRGRITGVAEHCRRLASVVGCNWRTQVPRSGHPFSQPRELVKFRMLIDAAIGAGWRPRPADEDYRVRALFLAAFVLVGLIVFGVLDALVLVGF